MRDKLIELLDAYGDDISFCDVCHRSPEDCEGCKNEQLAEYLLANGVIVTPCVAMVERFIKDGKFDKKHTAHNGRYAVVYVDKSKWGCPLIDITEQFYSAEKAEAALKQLQEDN